MPARVPVTAVLVAHDGSRWLPEALSALASSTAVPERLVAVDTGSADDSAALLRRATGHVLELPRSTGHAAAVHAALAAVPADTRWVWLLHDDCAPDPDALAALLHAAAADPAAAVLGPKVVDWQDPRVLVEIGCTTDGSGARDTGVEPGELDQGQHDAVRQVLAVGTAGALVRRDVWDQLGGLDPALPLHRDDVDLGWRASSAGHRVLVVPQARVRHARAATVGSREIDCAAGGTAAVDRRAALQVLLAHSPLLPLVLLRVLLASVLRAAGRLLLRQPRAARAELTAPWSTSPARLRAARRARAATRTVPQRELRPLMGSPLRRARSRLSALVDRSGSRPVPALDEPATAPDGRLQRRPGLLLTGVLAVLALVAERALMGRGALAGGELLPGAEDVLATYAGSHQPEVLLTPVVGLVLLGLVPLSGAMAYALSGLVTRAVPLRIWAAATWALLPVATGAVAAGRLDAALVHLALPPLVVVGLRLLVRDPREGGWSRPVAAGLVLTPVVAVAPLVWLVALVLLGGVALARLGAAAPAQRPARRRRLLAAALALAVPLVLVLPWSPQLLDPASLHGAGRVLPGDAQTGWRLLLLDPGGPGTPVVWTSVGLLIAALGGLLRARRVRLAAGGWGLALVGFGVAVVLAGVLVDGQPVWPGPALDLLALGLLLAALVAAEGLQGSLSRSSFGARQLVAVVVVLLAAAVPVLCAGQWLARGADGPLQRQRADALPAFVRAELEASPGRRALLLGPEPDGAVRYAVTGAPGPRLGDRPVRLDAAVADLLTPGGVAPAEALARRGIGFVSATADLPVLDGQPGLERQPGERPLWRVAVPVTSRPEDQAPGLPTALQPLALLLALVLARPARRPA